ncbi:MAG: DUF3857 and transglutaminase domain-containing protein [Deltaproteobacteria bacterium]|nr:DUF3857 and transglutaminase domain-containing protein [Deltaproteobacteria bacterium]
MSISRRTLPLALVALWSAAAGGCAGRTAPIEKFHTSHLADPGRYVDVPAVVLLERLELTYTFSAKQWQPYAELVHHRRIHLLKPEALSLRKIYIPYDATSGILDVTARVTHPDGSVEDLGAVPTVEFDRFAPSHPAATLYNDSAAKVFAVPGLQVGDAIEYRYRRIVKDASWLEPLRIGGPYPVERGEIAIVYPDGFDVDFRVLKAGQVVDLKPQRLPDRVRADPNDRSSEGVPGTRLMWVFENVPALYPEPYRPQDEALARQVLVQFKAFFFNNRSFDGFRGWNDVGRWYGRLIGNRDAPESSAKKALKDLGITQALPKSERVRRINRYLSDNIVPIEFAGSLASLKVHSAAGVLAARSGDAKDLSNTALGMLRAAGVEGFPVLCSRRGTRALAPDLPTPEAFNAVVVAVAGGGGYTFFSPAGYGLPSGRLPWYVQGTRGLLIRKSGAELIELPVDAAEDNRRLIEIHLSLAADGSARGTALLTLTGQDAGEVRLALKRHDAAGRVQFMQGFFLGEGSALAVTDVQEPRHSDGEQPLKLMVTLAANRLAVPAGQALKYTVTNLIGRPNAFLWREGRRTPLDLGYRLSERVVVSVAMPEGMGIWEQPQDRKRETPLVEIDDRFAVADGQAWFLRERVQRRVEVRPEDYADFKAFYEALWRHQDNAIQIIAGGDRGKDYQGDPF